ncbi:hypothetical protein TNCV_2921291 [Trichonephila clavipes]|nr:hypothetical protein TNCV_2921291 [Trichonephila clavipes]
MRGHSFKTVQPYCGPLSLNGHVCSTLSIDSRDSDSGAQNVNIEYESGTMSYFLTSSSSVRSILMAVYVFGGSEEIALCMLAFDVGIGTLKLV